MKRHDDKDKGDGAAAGTVRAKSKHSERTRQFTQPLACALTDKELRERASQWVEKERKQAELKKEMDDSADFYKSKIGTLSAEITALQKAIKTGAEERDVPCEEALDYDNHVVRVVRLDTKEQVSERPMTERERQKRLFEGDALSAGTPAAQ